MDSFFINPARMGALKAQFATVSQHQAMPRAMEDDDCGGYWCPPDGYASLGYEVVDGTAIICVNGAIASAQIHGWYWFGAMTYENLIATVTAAVNDGEVARILLRVNSPGGTVTGCAEAAAQLDKLSEQKPVWAHCSMADSAAYWLASAANRIIVDPTGEAGSIGVIMTHVDMTKMLESWGIDITHIFSGDKKSDGSPYQPLSKDALARFQSDMDYLRGIFVGSVAKYRGMDSAALMETEAGTYIGQLAVDAGLADEVGFFNDVLTAMAASIDAAAATQPATAKETSTMAKTRTAKTPTAAGGKPAAAAAAAADNPQDDEEDPAENDGDEEGEGEQPKAGDAADEEGDGKDKAAKPAAAQTGTEKARISAIIRHPEAKGREDLAEELAFETDLSPDAAAKILAKAPKAGAAKQETRLDAAMRTQANPKLGAGAGDAAAENPTLSDMKRRYGKK